MEKFETLPDFSHIIVINPDDQSMWSNTRTVAPTPSSAIIQRPISDNFRIKEAKIWLNELNEGTFTSWNEIREAFISRYFSPTKFKRLLNDIRNFHQLGNETLVEAWIRLKEMLRFCFGHGLTKVDEQLNPFQPCHQPNPSKLVTKPVSPLPKHCHRALSHYSDAEGLLDIVLLNHVGEKEFKLIVGDGIGVLTKKMIKKNDMGLSKEPAME
ncbi:reverse transcriptase domain-containing protein [Tanacetum coccineum]